LAVLRQVAMLAVGLRDDYMTFAAELLVLVSGAMVPGLILVGRSVIVLLNDEAPIARGSTACE
jgi:hypothetical protein